MSAETENSSIEMERLLSPVDKTARLMGWASDWANPILVKETRQSLKSRQFVMTFMLLLVAAWVITIFGLLNAGDSLDFNSSVGRGFFFAYYLVLSVAIFVVVPFGAYRSLLNERDENTFELLSITGLTPRRIVWGKLFSAMVQLFIYYSAIAPFIAFTSLLEGFDFALVVFMLIGSMFISLLYSMTALMLSTIARQKQWQMMMSLGVFGILMWQLLFFIPMTLFSSSITFDDPDFWWATGFFVVGTGSYFFLFQQITIAQLTFESGNRSSGIRVICSIQCWLLWLGLWLYSMVSGTSIGEDELFTIMFLSTMHWIVVGLFITAENDFLSRRIRRNLPASSTSRLFCIPFMPGGANGLLCVILHLGLLWIISLLLFSHVGMRDKWIQFSSGLAFYGIIYCGISTAIGRWGRLLSSGFSPAHVRVLVLILFVGGLIAPYIPLTLGLIDWRNYSLIYLTNPFTTLSEMSDNSGYNNVILSILGAAALFSVLVNSKAMFKAATGILSYKSPTSTEE